VVLLASCVEPHRSAKPHTSNTPDQPTVFISQFPVDTSPTDAYNHTMTKRFTIGIITLLGLVLLACFVILALCGCQTGTTGALRPIDAETFSSITNTIVGTVRAAGAVLPPPLGTIFEGVGAVAVAGLALWQTITHKSVGVNTAAITKLQNGAKT
jgi:hypothetical protein